MFFIIHFSFKLFTYANWLSLLWNMCAQILELWYCEFAFSCFIHDLSYRQCTSLMSLFSQDYYKPDIFFALETSIDYEVIPDIKDFSKYADKNLLQLNHGGIAMYTKDALAA